jgi:hypothetical protein
MSDLNLILDLAIFTLLAVASVLMGILIAEILAIVGVE